MALTNGRTDTSYIESNLCRAVYKKINMENSTYLNHRNNHAYSILKLCA